MSAAGKSRQTPPKPRPTRRRSPLAITVTVISVLVALVLMAAQFGTEILWYRQLGFDRVLLVKWGSQIGIFLAVGLLMGGVIFAAFSVAYRSRPVYAPSTPEQARLDQYREAVEPLRRAAMLIIPTLVGLFAGAASAAQWESFVLAVNRVPFGIKDPQFGIDVSFYVFVLPALRMVITLLMTTVIMAGIAGLVTHYLYGGIRIIPGAGGGLKVTRAARVQLSISAALVMVLMAANYWLDRYSILNSGGSKFDGASYADVNAVIPSKEILTMVALFVAVLFGVAAVRGNWRLPAVGVGLMVVAAIAIGGVYPSIVQRFQVAPNAQDFESKYIQRNIDATRDAYGIDTVETQEYEAVTTAQAGALRADTETTASIRLLDPQIVSPSFRQLQQNKQYYNFQDTLSVDRYTIEGQSRDTVIAVRELNQNGLGAAQRNWVNDHTVYTHGYGVVAAYGNQIGQDGNPAFYEGSVPSQGALTEAGGYEPRIYFSPSAPDYSIVGAAEGAKPWELDYPSSDEEGGQVNNTFPTDSVSAGPNVGSSWAKVMYSIKFGSEQILFSDRVTENSQIMYDRNPRDRVAKVAPYLTLDGRVYPAVVDKRVVWIVDGYTTTNQYPYSTSQSLESATADSLTARSSTVDALAPEQVNYIRNSVKAVVDAYDGSVTLYSWDDQDPILKAWTKVFPASVKPMSQISAELMSHMRYPEDLFKVQRTLLASYHVTDAKEFFSGQDFWRSPFDPTVETKPQPLQPPYYLTLQMPGQEQPTFSLMSTFVPGGGSDREILTGFLAVNAEAGNQAGQRDKDFGQLRLLELPRGATVPGPGQVQNSFNTNSAAADGLLALQRGDSSVTRGNLLTLPVGGGLVYVQPVYVESKEGTKFPKLRKVLVAFGEEVGFADTLDEALDQVFGGDSGANAGDANGSVDTKVPEQPVDPDDGSDSGTDSTPSPSPSPSDSGTPGPVDSAARADLDRALNAARQAITDGQEALKAGDFAAYGEAQQRLDQALQDAVEAEQRLDAAP